MAALSGKNGDYEKTIFNKTEQRFVLSTFYSKLEQANVAWNPRRVTRRERGKIELIIFTRNSIEKQP